MKQTCSVASDHIQRGKWPNVTQIKVVLEIFFIQVYLGPIPFLTFTPAPWPLTLSHKGSWLKSTPRKCDTSSQRH